MVTTERKSAEVRREEIVEAAFAEFAERGLYGTSTDAIARRAGVSQPYLFRLFGTKKQLFLAAVDRCYRVTLETFLKASEGKRGEEALEAVREVVQRNFGDLVEFIERVSGAEPKRVTEFVSFGMLLNVVATMDLLHAEHGWAKRLIKVCQE